MAPSESFKVGLRVTASVLVAALWTYSPTLAKATGVYPYGGWVVITVVVIQEGTVIEVVTKAINRLLGTLLGGVLGFIFGLPFYNGGRGIDFSDADVRWILLHAVLLTCFTFLWYSKGKTQTVAKKCPYAFLLGSMSFAIVYFAVSQGDVARGTARLVSIMWGLVVGSFIRTIVYPTTAEAALNGIATAGLKTITDALEKLGKYAHDGATRGASSPEDLGAYEVYDYRLDSMQEELAKIVAHSFKRGDALCAVSTKEITVVKDPDQRSCCHCRLRRCPTKELKILLRDVRRIALICGMLVPYLRKPSFLIGWSEDLLAHIRYMLLELCQVLLSVAEERKRGGACQAKQLLQHLTQLHEFNSVFTIRFVEANSARLVQEMSWGSPWPGPPKLLEVGEQSGEPSPTTSSTEGMVHSASMMKLDEWSTPPVPWSRKRRLEAKEDEGSNKKVEMNHMEGWLSEKRTSQLSRDDFVRLSTMRNFYAATSVLELLLRIVLRCEQLVVSVEKLEIFESSPALWLGTKGLPEEVDNKELEPSAKESKRDEQKSEPRGKSVMQQSSAGEEESDVEAEEELRENETKWPGQRQSPSFV
ncbi:unnamed protein product [Chrysoparadoxa australica]